VELGKNPYQDPKNPKIPVFSLKKSQGVPFSEKRTAWNRLSIFEKIGNK
jgi:hypothetical protein